MMSRLTIALLVCCGWGSLHLTAQSTLQIPFSPGRISPLTNVVQTTAGDYLSANFITGELLVGGSLNVTRFDPATGVSWSNDYTLALPAVNGQVAEWPSANGILLAAALNADTLKQALCLLDNDGALRWAVRLGDNDPNFNVNLAQVDLAPLPDGTALVAGGSGLIVSNVGSNYLYAARLNDQGQLLWARRYGYGQPGGLLQADAAFAGMIPTSDGNFLLYGLLQTPPNGATFNNVLLLKITPGGEVVWSRIFDTPGAGVVANDDQSLTAVELPNGNYVLGGLSANFADNTQDGLLLEVNAAGQAQRAQRIAIANSRHRVTIVDLVAIDNETVVAALSTSQDTLIDVAQEWNVMAQIRLDGGIDWQHLYLPEPVLGFGTVGASLLAIPGGGYLYFPNYADGFDTYFPYLLRTDTEGRTGCELPVNLRTVVVASNQIIANDVIPPLTSLNLIEPFAVAVDPFVGYTLPTTNLTSSLLCEGQTATLNGVTPNAIAYSWNTGATTPIITATAPGEYSVTVTFSDPGCSLLTATATVSVGQAPQLEVALDSLSLCADELLTYRATLLNGPAQLSWSTGDTSAQVSLPPADIYTLTATNDCGETTLTVDASDISCEEPCDPKFPNIFSPNGDGVNDEFRAFGNRCGEELQNFNLKLFNRWGKLVYESANPAEAWRGIYQGEPAPPDVYLWIAQYRLPNQAQVTAKGELTLLR